MAGVGSFALAAVAPGSSSPPGCANSIGCQRRAQRAVAKCPVLPPGGNTLTDVSFATMPDPCDRSRARTSARNAVRRRGRHTHRWRAACLQSHNCAEPNAGSARRSSRKTTRPNATVGAGTVTRCPEMWPLRRRPRPQSMHSPRIKGASDQWRIGPSAQSAPADRRQPSEDMPSRGAGILSRSARTSLSR